MPAELDVTCDRPVDAASFQIAPDVAAGDAVRQQMIEVEGRGELILDFDTEGRLLGIEVLGVGPVLRRSSLEILRRIDRGRSDARLAPHALDGPIEHRQAIDDRWVERRTA